MKNILITVKKFLYENKIHFIAFFVPAIILFAAFAVVGVYPFGEKSVLAVDFSTQYVYFFDYLHDVLSGKEGLFYNWSGSLSSGFFGTYAYYLASPFNLIVMMFPRESLIEGILTMLLVKTGSVGLTMSLFLRKHRGYSEFTSVLFAAIFALCGYTAANTINPMWLDGVIALPLIIAGIERLCRKRGFMLYTLSLFLAIIANYYIGYMLCVFSLLYFIYFVLSRKIALVRRKIGLFALSSGAAVLMSGFMIMPAFLPLFNGKLDGGLDRIDFSECFNIMDALLKLFPTVYDGQRWGGLPFLYCGLFALIFAVAYFLCGKISMRERISGGILCGLLMFSMYLRPLDNLWHGGRHPVWFEHRYSFLLIFLLILFGANAFEHMKKLRAKHIGAAFFILLGILLAASGMREREFINEQFIVIFSLIFLGIAGAFAAAAKSKPESIRVRALIFMFVCIELYSNVQSYVIGIDGDFGYQSREDYISQVSEMRGIAEKIKENDSGFYRFEKTFHRAFNDNIGAGIYGVSFSSSVYNTNVLEMMKEMGFGQYDWHTRYNGSTMLTDDIFGIKYVMSKNERLVPYSGKNGIVYENPDALPLAFLADEKIIGSIFASSSPFDYQQGLASALTGENEEIFTEIFDYKYSSRNIVKNGSYYQKNNESSDGVIMFTFFVPKSGPVYAFFPTEDERTCAMYVNGVYLRDYFNGFQHNTAYLGNFSEGEKVSVELRPYDKSTCFDAAIFSVLDETALEKFNAKIPQSSVEKTGNYSIEVELNAEKDCALFTTIPLESGWSAYIDGKKCEISTAVNDTLMCVKVPQGKHNVTLRYFPEGLAPGLAMTACGAVLFAAMLVVRFEKKRRAARV